MDTAVTETADLFARRGFATVEDVIPVEQIDKVLLISPHPNTKQYLTTRLPYI